MEYAFAIIGGYLLGSVPFGLVLTKLAGYGDIRSIGSGNIGATNVLRTGNKPLAFATLILDGTKGAIAVILAFYLMHGVYMDCSTMVFTEAADTSRCQSPFTFDTVPLVAGFFALVGHLFPIWLKFKGGKGVATTLGTLIALKPIVGLAACALWLLTALITRYSSLSALVALGATPIIAQVLYGNPNFTGFCGVIASLVFYKHRANIQRLIDKEEPKIGEKMSLFASHTPKIDLDEKEKIAWLRLIRTENVGPITFCQLMENFGTAQKAIEALPSLSRNGGRLKNLKIYDAGNAIAEMEQLQRIGGEMIFAAEKAYPRAQGPNKLIQDGATLVQNAPDILENIWTFSGIRPALEEPIQKSWHGEDLSEKDSETVRDLILQNMSMTPVTVDELVRSCHLTIPAVQMVLLELELAGRIQRLPVNQIVLIN